MNTKKPREKKRNEEEKGDVAKKFDDAFLIFAH